jgi:Leucine-rich repeat (LRR) protein
MKKLSTFLLIAFTASGLFAQDKYFRPTYVFEGQMEGKKKLEINLNFLVLLDSTIVGSYYYKPKSGSLKIVGQLNRDNSFSLVERDNQDKMTGYFKGILRDNFSVADGTWTSGDNKNTYKFIIKQVQGKSYWDYIRKFRSLKEYHGLDTAISEFDKVVSIDVANQGIVKLPAEFNKLKFIISANLLGNELDTLPIVLTELTQLEEISLSSNKIEFVGPEIGRLTQLRILIMNNNRLKSLPKELGQLDNLLYLELGNNQLTTLPTEIENLKQLQELHIERNRLDDQEKARLKKLLPNCVIHF